MRGSSTILMLAGAASVVASGAEISTRVCGNYDAGLGWRWWPDPGMGNITEVAHNASLSCLGVDFVVSNGSCSGIWGGAGQPVSDGTQAISEFRAAGGIPIVDLGGANGPYLKDDCASVDDLYVAYKQVVLDTCLNPDGSLAENAEIRFDYEGGSQDTNLDIHQKAMQKLLEEYPGLKVGYILSVMPDGFVAPGLGVMQSMVASGIPATYIGMTMDFGDQYTGDMGNYTISSGKGMAWQVAEAYADIGGEMPDGSVGVIPMLGINDVQDNIFTLDDAQDVGNWARGNANVSVVGYWSTNRDHDCNVMQNMNECSGVEQDDYEFAACFQGLSTCTP